MAKRSQARKIALQLLYQRDLNPDASVRIVRAMIDERLHDPSLREFAWELFVGVTERQETIDTLIEDAAENWTLARMAPTDRNILRLGAFEILHTTTPRVAAIDEAIELAKQFGTKQSSQFVNGILDRIGREPAEKT